MRISPTSDSQNPYAEWSTLLFKCGHGDTKQNSKHAPKFKAHEGLERSFCFVRNVFFSKIQHFTKTTNKKFKKNPVSCNISLIQWILFESSTSNNFKVQLRSTLSISTCWLLFNLIFCFIKINLKSLTFFGQLMDFVFLNFSHRKAYHWKKTRYIFTWWRWNA